MVWVASNQLNELVIAHLRGRLKTEELAAAPDSVHDPYMGQGSHPEVVQWVWDQIGKSLPADCQCLVYGSPARVHPVSGIILAFCLGTTYCLRLTPSLMERALKSGAKPSTQWASGVVTYAARSFGSDWVFGGWNKEELQWCREVYNVYNKPDQQP